MRKKILIVVDNPIRDLDACLLLSTELVKSMDVVLAPMSLAPAECFAHDPDYVLVNYLRPTNEFFLKALNTAGIPWGVMDTEGGVFSKMKEKDETSFTKTIHPDAALRQSLQHYFVWGEKLAEYLKDHEVYPKDKVKCLGTPRMDFYAKKLEFFLGDKNQKRQELTGQDKPVVLINTSFAMNNPKFSTREEEIQRLIKTFNYENDYVKKLAFDLDQVLHAYLDLTAQLCKNFPHLHFVLRPHPFESLDIYKSKLSMNSNISILCEKPVIEWLHICEALIHYKCTTAIEASLLNKPSFSLNQYEHIKDVNDVAEVTDFAANFEEMSQKLQSLINKQYQPPESLVAEKDRIEKDLFFKVDGQAYIRIANRLADFIASETRQKNKSYLLLQKAKYYARNHLKKAYRGFLVPKNKRLDLKTSKQILKRLNQSHLKIEQSDEQRSLVISA